MAPTSETPPPSVTAPSSNPASPVAGMDGHAGPANPTASGKATDAAGDGNGQPGTSVAPATEGKKFRSKPPRSGIKRPLNAFMKFRSAKQGELRKEHPELNIGDVSKKLGEMWKAMSDEEKGPWRDAAKEEAKTHKDAHPTYKYEPRRSSEIKRRQKKAH